MEKCFKYVMDTHHNFVMFPRGMSHKSMTRTDTTDRSKILLMAIGNEVRSAGFVEIRISSMNGTESYFNCYGGSETLGVSADTNDGEIMEIFYNLETA